MSRETFNVLRFLWLKSKHTINKLIRYEDIHTHFQSVPVNMLCNLGYLIRYSDGVTATDKTTKMSSEELYKINVI